MRSTAPMPTRSRSRRLDDGDAIEPKEIVLRIRARYRQFGLYETAVLGLMSQSTGWATAARECVDVAAPQPVISFGARHVHPDVTDNLDYAAIVGGCVGASTPAGARLAGLRPTGTMPHSLVLIFGDTVKAAEAFDRDLGPEVPRIVLVDTFRDEAEEALRVAHALGDRLYGIRLDTPSERGRVTADLVHEVRARLDQAGYDKVKIIVSGGLDPDRIRYFKEQGAPVDSYAVGSYISGARPVDFTGDLKEIDGNPIAKRGRIPGSDAQPAVAAGRSRCLAGALGEPRVRTDDDPAAPVPDDPGQPDDPGAPQPEDGGAHEDGRRLPGRTRPRQLGRTRPRCSMPWPSARRPTACCSAAPRSWRGAITPKRRSSLNARADWSPARARSSSRSRVPTTTAAASPRRPKPSRS